MALNVFSPISSLSALVLLRLKRVWKAASNLIVTPASSVLALFSACQQDVVRRHAQLVVIILPFPASSQTSVQRFLFPLNPKGPLITSTTLTIFALPEQSMVAPQRK